MFVVIVLLGAVALAARAAEPRARPPSVRQVVLDIMSYTRWPAAPAELRLCIVGQPNNANAFFEGDLVSGGIPVVARELSVGDDLIGADCDAIFEGPRAARQRATKTRKRLDFPVLTIGEATPGCFEATMFCLQYRGADISFYSNPDAIARGGLRVNPRVLLLGKRRAAAP